MIIRTDIPACPTRPDDAHKGTFGTVIVIGGCDTMIGAPALCASAALRGGAGLVKIAAPGRLLPHMLTIEPAATGIALDRSDAPLVDLLKRVDPDARAVLAVGPGLGQSPDSAALVRSLLDTRHAVVLDADGLNLLAFAGSPSGGRAAPLVMTPHPGEFRRLAAACGITENPTDPASRPLAAAMLAQAHHAIVVLKGSRTIVTDGQAVYVNQTGNPALATAGSGDVLTGLIASLMAQGMSAFDAAVLGVHLHGLAADIWAEAHGRSGLHAGDLARALPDAFERRRRQL